MTTCRLSLPSGRICRRSESHLAHGPHGPECKVPPDLHHAFVPARTAYGKFAGDPFVRTSVHVRRSDLAYLRETYGKRGTARQIRRMIADDRASRLVAGNEASPKIVAWYDDPVTEPPDPKRVAEALEWLREHDIPPTRKREKE